jgi:hypothetical protein
MSHSLCVMGMYDEVKMTVPMVVRYVHSDKKEKRNTPSTAPKDDASGVVPKATWLGTARRTTVCSIE